MDETTQTNCRGWTELKHMFLVCARSAPLSRGKTQVIDGSRYRGREAAWSWKWGLGAKSAVNAGAQRSKEREAQLARKDDIYPTIWNYSLRH